VSRHVLIRTEDEPERVVAETALPTEAELHDALTRHPHLIPMSDVGLGDAVVVGRESGLAAGYADLVLVDDRGRL
jgi:RecB family endonuclease NucS